MIENIFKFKSCDFKKLEEYGFKKQDGIYLFSTNIKDGEFNLKIFVDKNSFVSCKLYDNDTGDIYALAFQEEVAGEFVGSIRKEIIEVLEKISSACFFNETFKLKQSKKLIEFVKNNYGCELEFLWEKFSGDAIWRRHDNKKWFGLMIVLSKRKLGLNSDEMTEMLVFRIPKEEKMNIVDNKKIFEGYHMNKNSWATIILDGSVSDDELFNLIGQSYNLAAKK